MPTTNQEGQEPHLRDYIRVLRKRKWTVANVFFLIFLLGALYTLTMTPAYRATVKLIIEKENPNVLSIQEVFAIDSSGSDYYQSQYQIIESRSVAREAVKRLDLPSYEEFQIKEAAWLAILRNNLPWLHRMLAKEEMDPGEKEQKLLDKVVKRISVDPVRNSRLVDVSFEAQDPALAAAAADTIAQAYIDHNLNIKLKAVQDATRWLNLRIKEEASKVEKAELALQKYKEEQGIIMDFSGESEKVTSEKLAELSKQAVEVEAERVEAQTRYEQTRRLSNSPEILNNDLIQKIKEKEVEASQKLSELSKRYGRNHPQMKAVTAELATLQARKNHEIARIVNSLKNEYEIALAKEKSLKGALEELKREALDMNKKGIVYGKLKAERDKAKELYDVLITRFKETSLTEDVKTGNIRIVDAAEVPLEPVRPKKGLYLFLTCVMGLALGGGAAFFAEYLDNTIKSPDDIKRVLGLPYLAPVPYFDTSEAGDADYPEIVAHHSPKSTVSEAYRGLRTSLLLSSAEKSPQVILVTSAGAREGKTLTAVNLATTMAQAGGKVVVADCDLRRPRVHKVFGLERDKGVSNILAGGMAKGESYVFETRIENLEVIPSGPVPPNPSELLGSDEMVRMIEALRKHYDRVIIDSPPVTAVTDASILARLVDGVVLMLRAGGTTREMAKTALEGLNSVDARVLGAVLNGLDAGRDGHYYYQYYYYYYGEDGDRKRKRGPGRAA